MMRITEFIAWLKTKYPDCNIYNSFLPKKETQCISVYLKNRGTRIIAIGGYDNTSYASLPLSILIHWGQDADACQQIANGVYELLQNSSGETIAGHRVASFDLQDPGPVDVSRDENNICEMVIRLNIVYER